MQRDSRRRARYMVVLSRLEFGDLVQQVTFRYMFQIVNSIPGLLRFAGKRTSLRRTLTEG